MRLEEEEEKRREERRGVVVLGPLHFAQLPPSSHSPGLLEKCGDLGGLAGVDEMAAPAEEDEAVAQLEDLRPEVLLLFFRVEEDDAN